MRKRRIRTEKIRTRRNRERGGTTEEIKVRGSEDEIKIHPAERNEKGTDSADALMISRCWKRC